jgi:hypothetical protein
VAIDGTQKGDSECSEESSQNDADDNPESHFLQVIPTGGHRSSRRKVKIELFTIPEEVQVEALHCIVAEGNRSYERACHDTEYEQPIHSLHCVLYSFLIAALAA